MKHILKKIVVFVCLLTLVSSPAVAKAASQAVCVSETENGKNYEYQPDPYALTPNSSIFLSDVTGSGPNPGFFYIPAGKTVYFGINFTTQAPLKLEVIKESTGVVYTSYITEGYAFFSLPAQTSGSSYLIRITSQSETVNIINYFYMI